jgi:hypothetical protein
MSAKAPRVFSREFKEAAVRRILAGEKVLLARREVADRGRREPRALSAPGCGSRSRGRRRRPGPSE